MTRMSRSSYPHPQFLTEPRFPFVENEILALQLFLLRLKEFVTASWYLEILDLAWKCNFIRRWIQQCLNTDNYKPT